MTGSTGSDIIVWVIALISVIGGIGVVGALVSMGRAAYRKE